ncbi:hypothetical protein ACFQX7_26435 [Luedemannella flava]
MTRTLAPGRGPTSPTRALTGSAVPPSGPDTARVTADHVRERSGSRVASACASSPTVVPAPTVTARSTASPLSGPGSPSTRSCRTWA